MSVATTPHSTLDAFRDALKRKDFDALARCYAEDAVVVAYSERNRPGSAEELRGRDAILAPYREGPADLEHEISAGVAGDDRLGFTMVCTYPTGELVVGTAICELRDGLITRQVGVEAWDE